MVGVRGGDQLTADTTTARATHTAGVINATPTASTQASLRSDTNPSTSVPGSSGTRRRLRSAYRADGDAQHDRERDGEAVHGDVQTVPASHLSSIGPRPPGAHDATATTDSKGPRRGKCHSGNVSFDVFVQAFDDGVAGVAVTEADALPDRRADGQVVPTGKDLLALIEFSP